MGWGISQRSGTGWGNLGVARDGSRNIPEVWDGSGDPRSGEGRVGVTSERSGTGWGTFWRSTTGPGTLGEVRDGSGDPLRRPGRVG